MSIVTDSGIGAVYGSSGGGSSGPATQVTFQIVTATGQTWNGVADYVVLDSSAMGPGATFLLPALSSALDRAQLTIVNEDGANDVLITPNGADKINEVNLAVHTQALRSAMTLTGRFAATNWMVT